MKVDSFGGGNAGRALAAVDSGAVAGADDAGSARTEVKLAIGVLLAWGTAAGAGVAAEPGLAGRTVADARGPAGDGF